MNSDAGRMTCPNCDGAALSRALERAERAERALHGHGYRESCDIPACNCGNQWRHGGHFGDRFMEIAAIVPHNGVCLVTAIEMLMDEVEELHAAKSRERALREALEQAEACMSIVEPRSDKAEYLRILDVARAALARMEGGK